MLIYKQSYKIFAPGEFILFLPIHLLIDFDCQVNFSKNTNVFLVTAACTKLKLYFYQAVLLLKNYAAYEYFLEIKW